LREIPWLFHPPRNTWSIRIKGNPSHSNCLIRTRHNIIAANETAAIPPSSVTFQLPLVYSYHLGIHLFRTRSGNSIPPGKTHYTSLDKAVESCCIRLRITDLPSYSIQVLAWTRLLSSSTVYELNLSRDLIRTFLILLFLGSSLLSLSVLINTPSTGSSATTFASFCCWISVFFFLLKGLVYYIINSFSLLLLIPSNGEVYQQ
jgi:hypothetical protein